MFEVLLDWEEYIFTCKCYRATGGKYGFSVAIETKKVTANERAAGAIDVEGMEEEAETVVRNGQDSGAGSEAEGSSDVMSSGEEGSSPVKILVIIIIWSNRQTL